MGYRAKKYTFCSRILSALIMLALLGVPVKALQDDSIPLIGTGTRGDPYQIRSVDDLLLFSHEVNAGNRFEGNYFRQTVNIDLNEIDWIPIGEFGSENSFCGIYDGNGYWIENLTVVSEKNAGFFGQLGGTVMNLGIESGYLSGACMGAITSHSSQSSAKIINCYSKATVRGYRAGGIADNFNGAILNCWTDCEMIADGDGQIGGIVSYDATFAKNCYILKNSYAEKQSEHKGCTFVSSQQKTVLPSTLNENLYSVASFTGIDPTELNTWKMNEQGNIVMSQQKYSYHWGDILQYIRCSWVYMVPTIIVVITLTMLFLMTFKESGRFGRSHLE